ncbi:MAG TPA: hypothetical protein DCE71_00255 [Parachlamydiales bacterium]|nr:hypothetical protein [Parachlamydiales bacterium]
MNFSKQQTRYGAYGILKQNDQCLLTLKKSGPYKVLWDLPGGGIKFGEAPEQTLKREFLEETALSIGRGELSSVETFVTTYLLHGETVQFHHIGILYHVFDFAPEPEVSPEEEILWMPFRSMEKNKQPPFAQQVFI